MWCNLAQRGIRKSLGVLLMRQLLATLYNFIITVTFCKQSCSVCTKIQFKVAWLGVHNRWAFMVFYIWGKCLKQNGYRFSACIYSLRVKVRVALASFRVPERVIICSCVPACFSWMKILLHKGEYRYISVFRQEHKYSPQVPVLLAAVQRTCCSFRGSLDLVVHHIRNECLLH